MKTQTFLAVDLGATSGRAILTTIDGTTLHQRELTRFPNHIIASCGHLNWDIFALYHEVIEALKIVAREQIHIDSIGIDTWGVDFAFIGSDGGVLRTPYCYRDPYTDGMPQRFFSEQVPAKEVYNLTGIQVMNFNTLYQLYALRQQHNAALAAAEKILFVPDALSYMLTGEAVCEYTIASTSNMLNPRTKQLDPRLLQSVGLSANQFGRSVLPGTIIGALTADVQQQTGLGPVPVVAVAGHDTASAVAAVPALDKHFAYLSSGTWSLMGIETEQPIISADTQKENFTNEGGIEGTTRFLKNICGMWLLEQCRKEWKDAGQEVLNYDTLLSQTLQLDDVPALIDPDDASFANPSSMQQAIADYCHRTSQPVPTTQPQYCKCILYSLALRYREVFRLLQQFAPFPIERLHVIGGGSKNELLAQFTANALGVPVVTGPAEATAIGNVMMQAKAAGVVESIADMRQMIAHSVETKQFLPQDVETWKTYNIIR